MRKQGYLYRGFLLALVLVLLPIVAFSAQKITAGASCKVYKQKITYQSKQYTCIKFGKKLVWGKVVKIPTPTPSNTASIPTTISSPTPSPTTETVKSFSRSEIATHNKETDCWTYLETKVYDLTSWLPLHPSGSTLLLEMCGGDGAPSFRGHHNYEQDVAIATYYIGELK